MKIRKVQRKISITRAPEFENRKLATHALNVGLLCGHGCVYCSTPSMIRTHRFFKQTKRTSFESFQAGIAVVDPETPDRIAKSARRLKSSDTVMFCTSTDGWSPEAQSFQLGRKCLVQLLEKSKCNVRILTKNTAVRKDFDLLKRHADRIELSLSLTAPPSKSRVMRILEPNASPIEDRIETLREAADIGIPVYGIFCPCLPGIADTAENFGKLLDIVLPLEPTAIWSEPVNPRGAGLKNGVDRLRRYDMSREADCLNAIRNRQQYRRYTQKLIQTATSEAVKRNSLDLLNILVYGSRQDFPGDDRAVIWSG
jgi:DNA repair photolyase